MTNQELDELEKHYATVDVKVFNALRELRLENRILDRAYNDLYGQVYPNKPPITAHIRSS